MNENEIAEPLGPCRLRAGIRTRTRRLNAEASAPAVGLSMKTMDANGWPENLGDAPKMPIADAIRWMYQKGVNWNDDGQQPTR